MDLIKKINRRIYHCFNVLRSCYAKRFMKAPCVLSVDETLRLIVEEHYSISRNGDGELDLMIGRDIEFQNHNERLSEILRQALSAEMDKYMSCLLDIFSGYDYFTPSAHKYFDNYLKEKRYFYYRFAKSKYYGNAAVSRFYMDLSDKSVSGNRVRNLKKIWENQDVLLVEGKDSRLGVNNDLFEKANSVRRILGPAENAFDKYDDLMRETKKFAEVDTLVLLALGPTATAMAYELARDGYWAVDIGHIDIEYEWYLMGATRKVPVIGKYTNESTEGKLVGSLPQSALDKYESEVIARIY